MTSFFRRGQQSEEEKGIDLNGTAISDLPKNSSAFYVELLQLFLFVQKMSLYSALKPKLTILLSCWDKLGCAAGTAPLQLFGQKMPMLLNFIKNMWAEDMFTVMGLSSISKDLDKDKPDKEFQLKGPEKFGYCILASGDREDDITVLLNSVSV